MDNDPQYRDPAIYDTREVPSVGPDRPAAKSARDIEFNEPKRRRGCVTGCLAVMAILIILAIAFGLFARHEYDSLVNGGDSPGSTTTTTAPADAKAVNAVQYGEIVGEDGSVLQADAKDVSSVCKNVVTQKAQCQDAIGVFTTQLAVTKTDLSKIKAPAGLTKSDAKLRQAVNDGSTGSAEVNTGLSGHPITLIKGLANVARAATELKAAEDQLNGDLGSTTTMVTR